MPNRGNTLAGTAEKPQADTWIMASSAQTHCQPVYQAWAAARYLLTHCAPRSTPVPRTHRWQIGAHDAIEATRDRGVVVLACQRPARNLHI